MIQKIKELEGLINELSLWNIIIITFMYVILGFLIYETVRNSKGWLPYLIMFSVSFGVIRYCILSSAINKVEKNNGK